MTFLVTIDGAGGEVKDLEHHIGSLHWQPPVILREICSPMMPPGAHITDRSRISPVLPRPLSGRLLSSQALANGEGRGADSFVGNCRLMRRDVGITASLRTDLSIYALYGIICAQRRQSGNASAHWLHIKGCCFGRPSEQIYLGKRLPARASYNSWVSIDCFSCKIMPFFNFSHRLLQVILFSMTTGLYTHIRMTSKAGRPSRAALPR